MATKKKTEKKAKKFEYTRAQVAERLEEIVNQLADIDTGEVAPNVLADDLATIREELSDISYELTEEKYDSYNP